MGKTVLDIVHNLPSAHTNPAIAALEQILDERRHRVAMLRQDIEDHRAKIAALESQAAHITLDILDLEVALDRVTTR